MPIELAVRPAASALPAEAIGPAALLRDLSSHFPALGITRLASQTGLDRLGIPSCAAIRPNSLTIASHQGKGIDEVSAQISAVMEAAEYAIAEAPETATRTLSLAEAREQGIATLSVAHLLPRGIAIADTTPIHWLEGIVVDSGKPVLVPYDAVALGVPPAEFPGLSQSTNGLAAGTSFEGALLHALCELIERDAVCLWGFKSDAAALATAIAPAEFKDRDIDALTAKVAAGGCNLNLFDLTGNTGVPAIYAVISPGDGADRHFDAATGAACHPVAAVAARRAIVEAAQTRITNIAGARDDIVNAEYDQQLSRSLAVLTEARPTNRRPPAGLGTGAALADMLAFVQAGLLRAKLGAPVAVVLGGEGLGFVVLKAFVPGLEDRLTNRNWRPGSRAAAAMLGLM